MKVFVFDTETTGFMNKKEENNLEIQPYLIQFAGILGEIDENLNYKELERINQLVKPKIPIPYESSQIHHIYDIDVMDKPEIKDVISNFLKLLNSADIVVGHNIEYDEFVINTELKRLGRFGEYKPAQVICTMKETVDFCALKGNGERFKYPKLGELYKKLFGDFFVGAHDAMIDVESTMKVFLELNKKGLIKIEKKNVPLSLF